MKTPQCKECKGTGNIHVEGNFIGIPLDVPCWVCGGSNFKGMNKEQVMWYLLQYKTIEKLKSSSLRAGEITEQVKFQTIKNQITKTCAKLGIQMYPIVRTEASGIQGGNSTAMLTMRNEFNEFHRRLTQIPITIAARVQ